MHWVYTSLVEGLACGKLQPEALVALTVVRRQRGDAHRRLVRVRVGVRD